MFETLQQLAATAFMKRLTLLLIHVLAAVDARARPPAHRIAGRSVRMQLTGWPRLLPPPPALALSWSRRPALLEWCGARRPGASTCRSTPPTGALRARGCRPAPPVEVAATRHRHDFSWLMDNLRWTCRTTARVCRQRRRTSWRAGRGLAGGCASAFARRRGARARRPPEPPVR
jgi:hypothetical protein